MTSHARCDSPDEAASEVERSLRRRRAIVLTVRPGQRPHARQRACPMGFTKSREVYRDRAGGARRLRRDWTGSSILASSTPCCRRLRPHVRRGTDRQAGRGCSVRSSTATWRPEIDRAGRRITLGTSHRPRRQSARDGRWTPQRDCWPTTRQRSWSTPAVTSRCAVTDRPGMDGSVAIEDPRDLTLTIAVLRLTDASCATSSTGRRRWRVAATERHHLIDPRTGRPRRAVFGRSPSSHRPR